jgi:hypothetical protein
VYRPSCEKRISRRILTLCALLLPSVAAAAPALSARVVSPLVQLFPSAVPPGEPEARLEAARGEWEPFQIVVRSSDGALAAVSAEAAPLVGPAGAVITAPRLYRVDYLDVTTPSSDEGHPGRWPDALVPDVDAFVGEKRRAFPFDVPAGESRALWVEIFVPEATAPGVYHGQVRIAPVGQAPTIVPVTLTVHNFTLPKSSSLPVTFGFTAGAVAKQHPGLSGKQQAELVERYEVLALRHRLSLHGGSLEPPPWHVRDGKPIVDFGSYDAEVAPFLDGTADRGGPAEGARWTAFELRVPAKIVGIDRAQYVKQLVEHLQKRGWLDRVFDYTSDEPGEPQFAEVVQKAAALHALAPAVPRLVTRAWDTRLKGSVDIWCPVVNYVDDKPGNSDSPPRKIYDKEQQRLWWYQSCMSHGCNVVGGDYFSGWPSYVVDAPAMSHRILEWLTFRYHVGGELYYNSVEGYAKGLDPWKNQLLFAGNGDGTLFYPGRPDVIGGKSDIPVASIRLALIREGLEDYEYLKLYAAAAGQKQADSLAASIASKTYHWEHDPARLMAARHRMADAIDRAVASGKRIGITAR